MNNEAAEQACKDLGKAVVAAVRASSGIPTGRDHEYYSTFPQFRNALGSGKGGAGRKVLEVIDRIISHQMPNAPACRMAGSGLDSDEILDKIVDFSDEKLEKVDCMIDEVLGRGANVKAAGVVDESRAALHGRTRGKRSGAKGTPQDLDLPKPQLRFEDRVDNSDAPFVPVAWKKIHSVSDAAPHGGGSAHPYAAEVEALQYDTTQLVAPTQIVDSLPIDETPLTWVDTSAQLAQLCHTLERCAEFGVDLEHHSVRSFQGFTCLMQISTREHDYLVDTIALRGHMHMLLGAFTNPKITKIFHGADSDVKWLQRDFGLYVVNLFDTGQAARVLELPSFSFAHLLESLCGQLTDKKYQLADWRLRPLPLELIRYARMDTHFLPFLYDKLRAMLAERAGGSDKLVRTVLSKSNTVCLQEYEKEVFDPNGYSALVSRSGKALTASQTSVFAGLYAWRDRTAREQDESHHYVLPNALMFKLATSSAKDSASVLEVCRPTVPPLVREAADKVAEVIAHSMSNEAGGDMAVEPQQKEVKEDVKAGIPDEGEVYEQAAWVLDESDGSFAASQGPPPEISVAEQNKTMSSSTPGPTSLFSRQMTVQGSSKGDPAAARAKVLEVLASLGCFAALSGAAVSAAGSQENLNSAATEAKHTHAEAPHSHDEAESEMPKSINEIFKLSNQNRKRNQDKRRRKGGVGAGEGEGNREGESDDEIGEEDGDKSEHGARGSDVSKADMYLKSSAELHSQDSETFLKAIGWSGDKTAKGEPSQAGKKGNAPGGGESKGGEFTPFDYSSMGGWEAGFGGNRKQQPQVPQFDPHAGVEEKAGGKQHRGTKLQGKGQTFKGSGGKGKR